MTQAATTPSHPVLELLSRRAAEKSYPGRREDAASLALVIEGGGMRGVVSSAMTAALERRGLTDCFDLVVGTSAGSLNGAALLAGVAGACCEAYHSSFATRRFINPYRLLIGRAAIDVAFTLAYSDERLDAARHGRTVASPIALHCLAVDVETAEPVALTDFGSPEELCEGLLASSRLPWVGGRPVAFRGRSYLDGGLAESIPHRSALALGATHALVLQTRPWGVRRTPPPRVADRLIAGRLRRINPALLQLYRRRSDDYETAVQDIARRTTEPQPPFVYGLRLPRESPVVDQLERDADRLRDAARHSERFTEAWLDEALAG